MHTRKFLYNSRTSWQLLAPYTKPPQILQIRGNLRELAAGGVFWGAQRHKRARRELRGVRAQRKNAVHTFKAVQRELEDVASARACVGYIYGIKYFRGGKKIKKK